MKIKNLYKFGKKLLEKKKKNITGGGLVFY